MPPADVDLGKMDEAEIEDWFPSPILFEGYETAGMLEDTETIGIPPTPLFIPQEDTTGLGPALSDRYLLV